MKVWMVRAKVKAEDGPSRSCIGILTIPMLLTLERKVIFQ